MTWIIVVVGIVVVLFPLLRAMASTNNVECENDDAEQEEWLREWTERRRERLNSGSGK